MLYLHLNENNQTYMHDVFIINEYAHDIHKNSELPENFQ